MFRIIKTIAFSLFVFGCSNAVLEPEMMMNPIEVEKPITVTVHYGTNRLSVPGTPKDNPQYLDQRGKMQLGHKVVNIPLNHREGVLETKGIFDRLKSDKEFFTIIDGKVYQNPNIFSDKLKEMVSAREGNSLFIYIHGFNTTFENAIVRSAQLTWDLRTKEKDLIPLVFSWPSGHTTAGYDIVNDYMKAWTNREWAKKDLADFLLLATKDTQPENVFIVAHSLGAGLLSAALEQIRITTSTNVKLFNQIILAGADIDTDTFKNVISPRFTELAKNTTIYVTDKDGPLRASVKLHAGEPRLGDVSNIKNIAIVENMETVNVLGVDFSLFGHSYYAEMKGPLNDMRSLIKGHWPDRRKAVESENGTYWILKP